MILTDQEHGSLVAEFTKNVDAIKGITNLGQELTQDKLEEGKRLKARNNEIQAKIKGHNEAVDLKRGNAADESFLNDPVRKLPVPDGSGAETQDSGNTYIEVDEKGNRRVVCEDGVGTFGEKTWKAISSKEYRGVMRKYIRDGLNSLSLAERKTLETGLDPQGGYTIPIDSLARVVQRKPTPTRVAGMVSTIDTARDFVDMMKVNYSADNVYTTGFRVTKTGENPTSATQARVTDTNLFGVVTIPIHTFMLTGILTQNQVEDSALNILGWMGDKFGETVDILWDDKVINGTSKGEATGLLTGIDVDANYINSVVTGSAAAITADSLLDIANDIPEQYDDNCQYLFNKTSTYKSIRKLKDSSNRYLFGMGYQDSGLRVTNKANDLNGYPFQFSALMPNQGANAYPVLFGDFRGYQLVRRVGFSVQVLRELYAELNQVAIVGRVRFGGQTIEPWRLRALKCST